MFDILALLALLGGLICLYRLWVIDLAEGLLPNEYVLGFLMCGALFHLATAFHFLSPADMALGGIIGGGSLYLVRSAANRLYKKDALGWGDIKLLAAAGILLGPYYILLAMAAGASAGILHGLMLRFKNKGALRLHELSLPAGPGFIIGIIFAAALAFQKFPGVL